MKLDIIQHANDKNDIIIPSLLLFMILTSMWSALLWIPIFPILVYLCNRKLKYDKEYNLNYIDFALLLICVTEIILSFFSYYRPKTLISLYRVIAGVVLWFFMRICVNNKRIVRRVLYSLSLMTVVISALTIFSYLKHRTAFIKLGYNDLTVIRQFYHPLGNISNDWVAVLLVFLPIPISSFFLTKSKWPKLLHFSSLTCTNIALLVSYSRGAYLALIVFYSTILFISLLKNNDEFVHFLILSTLSITFSVMTLLPDIKSVQTTCKLQQTTVQRRSISGRYIKWKESLELYKRFSITGVGCGNYELASGLYGLKDFDSMSYRSTNSYLQILVEKGVIGTLSYIIAVSMILIEFFQHRIVRLHGIPFVAAIAAFMVREFFFCTYFEDNRFPILFVLTLFFIFFYIDNDASDTSDMD